MSEIARSPSFAADLEIRPLAGRIGAQIDNIYLTGDLPEATLTAMEAALSTYKVIFSATRANSTMLSRNASRRALVMLLPIRQCRGAPALPFWSLIRLMAAGVPIAGTPT
jgi:hypothetical protein